MSPRANFSCAHCTKLAGHIDAEIVYEDLPLTSKHCPVCGFRRGFRRRFDAINVSTNGHRVAKILDPMMRPQLEQADKLKADVSESHKKLVEEHERGIAHAPKEAQPALREALAKGPVQWTPNPAQTLGMIPGGARLDSRTHLFPHIRRRVVPGPV